MLFLGLSESLSGWPSFALVVLGSAAFAVLTFVVSRKLALADRLLFVHAATPPALDRVRQLTACAEYGADYGFTALPDFPPCAKDPVLARAATLFVENAHPDDLGAVLDAELQSWIVERIKRALLIRRTRLLLPGMGFAGLLAGLLGTLAIANGWFPHGLPAAVLVFVATLVGILATALGSAGSISRAVVDPAAILDRQIINAAMVALRQRKGAREIEAILIGFLPAADRAHASVKARAA